MMLVCVVYFHTKWQINEDTIQCRIVVTVWEKFSQFWWFQLVWTNKSLGISQRWWRKTWRFRWLKDVYPSSLFTDFLFLGREKSCYCFSLIFTYNLFTGAVSPRGGFVGNRQNPIPPFQLSEMSQGCGDSSDVDHQLCSAGALCVLYWLVSVSRRWGCRW